MSEPLKAKVDQHTTEIAELTRNVDRLVTAIEYVEKGRASDTNDMKELVKGMNTLNEKVGVALNLAEQVAQVREDVRAASHDAKSALQALTIIPALVDRLGKVEAKSDALEKWQDKFDGGKAAIGKLGAGFWAVFGSIITAAVLALGYFVLQQYFINEQSTGRITANEVNIERMDNE